MHSYHKKKSKTRFKFSSYLRMIIATILAFVIAFLPTDTFGIEGLNAVQQRVIAIFVFAAIMWLTEAIPSWCTSVLIIVVMLFTISDKGLTPFMGVEDAIYVQFLINPTELKLAIRPCEEGARDAVRWCNVREDKRKSRQITCKPLAEKLFALMDWEAVYSYRFQGMKIDYDGEIYYMFDLSGSEPYLPRRRDPETGKVIPSQTIVREDWKDSFGMNFAEHEASQKIDLMQGYVTAAVTEDAPIVTAEIK